MLGNLESFCLWAVAVVKENSEIATIALVLIVLLAAETGAKSFAVAAVMFAVPVHQLFVAAVVEQKSLAVVVAEQQRVVVAVVDH